MERTMENVKKSEIERLASGDQMRKAKTKVGISLTTSVPTPLPNDTESENCGCWKTPPEWCTTFVWTLVSMLLYLVDTGLDIWMAWEFYSNGHFILFGLTLTFVLVPAVVVSVMSSLMYLKTVVFDYRRDGRDGNCAGTLTYIGFILSMLSFGPVVSNIIVLYSCIRLSRGTLVSDSRMHRVETLGIFLRFVERFLEAVPQAVLQLYVIINHIYHPDSDIGGGWVICVSCLFSLVSLALSLTTFMTAWKLITNTYLDEFENKEDEEDVRMGLFAKSLYMVWNFCFICCRVWTLVIFAYAFPRTVLMVCGVHWVCTWIWFTYKNSGTCDSWGSFKLSINLLVNIGIGFIYILVPCFIRKTSKGRGKVKAYAVLYSIYFVQNLALIGVTFIYLSAPPVILWATVISGVLFMSGIILMLVYYRWFHPRVKDKFETTCQALKYLLTGRTRNDEESFDEY